MKKVSNGNLDLLKEVYWEEKVDEKIVERIYEVLGELSPREEKIIRLRFGLDDNISRTYEEIGKELGVSASAICHFAHRAIKKLRHSTRKEKIYG